MANKKLLDLDGLKRYNSKVNEELSRKQESLISGTNIKTINNQSILGSGNIQLATEPVSITDEEIGDLFEQDLLSQKYVSQDDIQDAINSGY